MKSTELVKRCKDIANMNTVYALGTFGQILTDKLIEQKQKQLPKWYTDTRVKTLKKKVGSTVFALDCSGLIKAVMFGFTGDTVSPTGGGKYTASYDLSADQMYANGEDKSNDFSNIEIGEAVHCSGHIGIYIGNGLAVECTPKWNNCVQVTAVANIGEKAGYNSRKWTNHCKLSFIEYGDTIKVEDTVKTCIVVTKGSNLNVRRKPNGDRISGYKNNTKLTVIDSSDSKWWLVSGYDYLGRLTVGYCSTDYLRGI